MTRDAVHYTLKDVHRLEWKLLVLAKITHFSELVNLCKTLIKGKLVFTADMFDTFDTSDNFDITFQKIPWNETTSSIFSGKNSPFHEMLSKKKKNQLNSLVKKI